MKEYFETLGKISATITVLAVMIVGFQAIGIVQNDDKKSNFNACRDTGRSVISCVTGLK